MCDTLAALPAATARGATLFAKNSDRERNEAQILEVHPARDHGPDAVLRATYIAIPQAPRTHAFLISRPFWMWGAEMGANEHGVAIGNEAVHSIVPAERRRALTGMDLVRLGLERAASAAEAVQVITTLLERHGQGGDCGHLGRFYYHNSFLIADRGEAFVLETVGRWWALEAVEDIRTISNALSIGAERRRVSEGLEAYARGADWLDGQGDFDLADRLMDRSRDAVTRGVERCRRSSDLLRARRGALDASDLRAALRDHGEVSPDWTPVEIVGRTICMHAGPGDRRSQTVAAMVSELGPGPAVHWVTGGAAPCLSLFRPVVLEAGLPEHGPPATDRFDPGSLWWRQERLHRLALANYAALAPTISAERDGIERAFQMRIEAAGDDPPALKQAVERCWREADAALDRWTELARNTSPARPGHSAYARSWRRLNQVAGFSAA